MNANLKQAIEEQQERVWRLRSLLDALRGAVIGGADLDDEEAALDGLIECADSIHLALDPDALNSRAQEISDDTARAREREEAYRRRQQEAQGDAGPDAPPSVN